MDRSRVQEYAERLQNSEGSSPGFSQQLAWAWLERDARVAELEKENTALRGIIANLLGEKP